MTREEKVGGCLVEWDNVISLKIGESGAQNTPYKVHLIPRGLFTYLYQNISTQYLTDWIRMSQKQLVKNHDVSNRKKIAQFDDDPHLACMGPVSKCWQKIMGWAGHQKNRNILMTSFRDTATISFSLRINFASATSHNLFRIFNQIIFLAWNNSHIREIRGATW